MRVSDVISNVTKQNMNVMARLASLLSKVMYIIKRKFKCLSWIWLLFHLVKWKKCIFHSCLRHSWNIHVFTSLDEIKVIFTPNIWISSIYSFAVNTINIVIEWNENISIFTSAKHEWKFECFHYTRWTFLWYSLKKSKFSFYFIVHTSMRVSDVISNVTKQNINVMASTLSA